MKKQPLKQLAALVIDGKLSIATYYTLAAERFIKTTTAEALLIRVRAERKED